MRNTARPVVPDNRWFEYRIMVTGKTIRTYINGELICQYTESSKHWRAENKPGRWLDRGTFALQGHDPKSVVKFRNLRVRVLPESEPSVTAPMVDLELDELISRHSDANYALIDVGIQPGSVSLQQAQARDARRLGYSLGYLWPDGGLRAENLPSNITLIHDRDQPPSVKLLKAAKAKGSPIVFSSGGDTWLSPERVRARLQAIQAAGLEWTDLWFPSEG